MKYECYRQKKRLSAHGDGAERYDSVQDGTDGTPIFLGWIQYRLFFCRIEQKNDARQAAEDENQYADPGQGSAC